MNVVLNWYPRGLLQACWRLTVCLAAGASAFPQETPGGAPTPAREAEPGGSPAPPGAFPPDAPAVADASPGEVDQFLEDWARTMKEIRSMTMRFRQEKRLRILRRPRVSEGDLAYADGQLSVVVTAKDGEVESRLLMAGGELRILYPQLKRLEVIPFGAGPPPPAGGAGSTPGTDPQATSRAPPRAPPAGAGGPSIPFFAGDPRDAKKDYVVALRKKDQDAYLILLPRDPKVPVRRIELKLSGFELREYRQVEANGDELQMKILAAERNPTVDPARFRLEIPPGTTTVRPTGK